MHDPNPHLENVSFPELQFGADPWGPPSGAPTHILVYLLKPQTGEVLALPLTIEQARNVAARIIDIAQAIEGGYVTGF